MGAGRQGVGCEAGLIRPATVQCFHGCVIFAPDIHALDRNHRGHATDEGSLTSPAQGAVGRERSRYMSAEGTLKVPIRAVAASLHSASRHVHASEMAPACGSAFLVTTRFGSRRLHPQKSGTLEAGRWCSQLLAGPYFLITFTLPAELRPLAWAHQRVVYAALMDCAWQTLRRIRPQPSPAARLPRRGGGAAHAQPLAGLPPACAPGDAGGGAGCPAAAVAAAAARPGLSVQPQGAGQGLARQVSAIGVIRPLRSRRNPATRGPARATTESAYTGHAGVGIYRPARSRHKPATA